MQEIFTSKEHPVLKSVHILYLEHELIILKTDSINLCLEIIYITNKNTNDVWVKLLFLPLIKYTKM